MPAKIWFEPRKNVRASIGKTGAILRLPYMIGKKEYQKHYDWFLKWVDESLVKNPVLQKHFFEKTYEQGQEIIVGKRAYILDFQTRPRRTASARLNRNVISIIAPEDLTGLAESKAIKTLISRVVGADFLAEITARVYTLNEEFFQKPVGDIRLKYIHSRWGSCSARGNINLSTRLLFAPDEVIDYVIIHELAHLVEHNHSPEFWKEVARAMPDYKRHEKWLKENNHLCDF